VFGLIAACLGVDRTDEDAHQTLNTEYGLALRIEQCGEQLEDYHTVQVAPAGAYPTRRAELAAPGAGTEQSWRYYRTDLFVLLAVWPREPDTARWSLDALAEAMEHPRFQPYFGRVSCPLSGRLNPIIVESTDPVSALAWRAGNDSGLRIMGRTPLTHPVVTLDAADARQFGLTYQRVEMRRDALANRARWQFNLREEAVL
jgi:CRISPR system Cascade subunit CasD